MFLLIDECCGKGLVSVAEAAGHVAQRTIEVAQLGRGASDADIFGFAAAHGAVVVTINQGDFVNLSGRAARGAGLILMPNARGTELARIFRAGLPAAAMILAARPTTMVSIDTDGGATELPSA
jgi:predicted nuclease of predicted toxin-antitoxin system